MALRTVTRKLGSKLLPRFSSTSLLHSHATSFGFKEVHEEEKSRLVGNVFSSVASSYDLMNDIMSVGLHRLWKDRLVSKLNPFPGMKHLDVAGGTGFKEVHEEEKSRLVGNVFSSVASSYDLMNDIMSVGLHRLWKDKLVSKLNPFPGMKHLDVAGGTGQHNILVSKLNPFPGMKHLDVAGGTGDVAFRILETLNSVKRRATQDVLEDNLHKETQIFVCDINPNMLNVGKKRAMERGLGEDKSLIWVEGDAEALKFKDNSLDGYTIAFGIRNVTHIEKVLAEAYRVLKRGGRFLCLELSHVEVPVFKELYDCYSFFVIPTVGELVAGDRNSYQYLVESIRCFPSQETFASMIAAAGFQKVEYENLVGGVVAIHSGLKFQMYISTLG
ncbi:2-methoxy-6-polyprenyl-1 [Quercus suber]|uniref:2-methoxy-6-polyprenyl-1,4-benzoquinol methylase, mitochondrial n=1 Tax=Quercus suber TaxID=58331 RepID=A0AAW0KTN1_QUESU